MGKGLILFRRQFFMRELENRIFREEKMSTRIEGKQDFLAKYQFKQKKKKKTQLFFNIPINGALLRCPVGI